MSSEQVHIRARAACRTRLATVAGYLGDANVAFEGASFQPVGAAFLEDKLVADYSDPRAAGAIEHKISYILTLKYPADEGTGAIELMAGRLLDHFKVGTVLSYAGQSFLCYKAERRGAIQQFTDWQVLTVAVTLHCFTTD